MVERISILSPERKEEDFFKCLKEIVKEFTHCEIPIALVGGIPLEAYLGNGISGFRKNGSVRDLDAIAYCKNEDDIQKIKKLNMELRASRRINPNYPEVGIEPLFVGQPIEKEPKLRSLLSEIYVDYSGGTARFYLHFGTVTHEIPRESMEIVMVRFGGVEIPTLRPTTIWFCYFIRGVSGTLKPKDFLKVGQLYNKLVNENTNIDYQPFNSFTAEVREKYPERAALFTLYWSTAGEYLSSLSFANDAKEWFQR